MNAPLSDADILKILKGEAKRHGDPANLQLYARKCLRIAEKEGGNLKPFRLNRSQRYIHEQLERQRAETGMVRAVILKARQLGCSTYVGARFYQRTSLHMGMRAFILTHKQDTTDALFAMVERFHKNNNPLLTPHTGKSNAKELTFTNGGYRVGTAGSAGVGLGETTQLFHGSECAFWANAEDHAGGVMQTIALAPGTEVILESTANGLSGYFAEEYSKAAAGKSLFQAIFIPWFWGEDYRLAAPKGFELSDEDREYQRAYGLEDEQMVWFVTKRAEFKELWRFTMMYPATPEEAFQSSGEGNYIKPMAVAKARRTVVTPASYIPIIIGIDPARGGRDSTAVIDRQGRRAGRLICEEWDTPDAMVLAGKIVKLITTFRPKKIIIDATEGTGAAICDRLTELNYGRFIEPVKFSQSASEKALYLNKRAEMWATMKEWFDNPLGVQVPNEPKQIADDLQAQVCAPIWGPGATRHNSDSQLVLEPKEHIVKRLKRSPDLADALAMTFAIPVIPEVPDAPVIDAQPADSGAGY